MGDVNMKKERRKESKEKEEINKDVSISKRKEIQKKIISEKSEIVCDKEIKVSPRSTPSQRNKSKIISMQAVNNDSSVDYVPSKQSGRQTNGNKVSSKKDSIKRVATETKVKEENKAINVHLPIKKDRSEEKPSMSVLNTDRSETSSVTSEMSTTLSKQRVTSGKQT